jgi:hypothetical protein
VRAEQTRLLRWLLLVLVTAVGGWLAFRLGGLLVLLATGGSPGLLRLLLGAYAALASGYVFSAAVTRIAPGRSYAVAVALVFVTVIVAAALMLEDNSEGGPIPAVLLGISLVVGAFGYALRVRGFSETVSGREA